MSRKRWLIAMLKFVKDELNIRGRDDKYLSPSHQNDSFLFGALVEA